MKNILIFIVAVLSIVGCGGSNGEKYTVTDDGNGTRSPRISRAIVAPTDESGETDEYSILYRYDSQNLLVQKRYNYLDHNRTDIDTYTYNNLKQIASLIIDSPMAHGRTETEFIYSESVWEKSKKPVLIQTKHRYGLYDDNGKYYGKPTEYSIFYHYKYNERGEAIQLESSELPYEYGDKTIVQYIYDKTGKLIQEYANGDKTKEYVYNHYGNLKSEYTYNYSRMGTNTRIDYLYNNKQLLTMSKEYNIDDDGKETLVKTITYFYENKPYYSNPSPSYLDQGQYSSSGIY